MNITELESKSRDELTEIAREAGISNAANLKKPELVYRLLQSQGDGKGDVAASGVLDVVEDGYGFLRQQRFLRARLMCMSRSRRSVALDCERATSSQATFARPRTRRSTSACYVWSWSMT